MVNIDDLGSTNNVKGIPLRPILATISFSMIKLLKLQHHRHTAKRLAHHHTSYRALFVILFIFGFSLLLIQRTGALDLTVTANINADPPNGPATINSPASGSTFSSSNSVVVDGICPTVNSGQLVVSLWRGSIMLGSAPCTSGAV